MEIIKRVLIIYSWAVVGILLIFLWRIAYFYEKASGQSVRYYFLILPVLLLAAGAIWYLACRIEFIGLPIGDLLLFSGGVLICMFGFRLQELMTGR
jgi:hypothetical protein